MRGHVLAGVVYRLESHHKFERQPMRYRSPSGPTIVSTEEGGAPSSATHKAISQAPGLDTVLERNVRALQERRAREEAAATFQGRVAAKISPQHGRHLSAAGGIRAVDCRQPWITVQHPALRPIVVA
jgi:hypothetical protein